MATALSLKTLPDLPARVARPSYARNDLSHGIVHFGVGNFHRAHLQIYLDRLMNAGRDLDWAIVGAGVTPYDARMRDALAGQDWLSTVVEQSAATSEARVTGVMTDFLPPMDGRAIVAGLADPTTRIASLTVTEGGYFVNPALGKFDPEHPAILADARNPDDPKTVFGLILAGLKARRAAGRAPFTVMSCDNVPHNGNVCRDAVAGLAAAQDAGFAAWVRENVAFPNAMVDRIAPATSDRERAITRDEFGIEDAWPVFCEDFIQWVVEDRFTAGRPAFEAVGAEFVADVTPWEMMKIRILNGGHAIIAYPAGLMDIHFVHEGMENPLVRAFLQKLERDEIIPIVPPVPNTDLDGYFRKVEERCLNPKIGDTIRRLCLDGSNRQPKFIIPSIADRLARGLPVEGLALESALWCRYCEGTTDSGKVTEPNDPNWDRLQAQARAAKSDPAAWLSMADIYGRTAEVPAFTDAFARWLRALWADGTEATLRRYLG
ncbi:MAG TPA: mannitol dehydrogenase family protein [Amaricoccus sp.]|mgnify:CR=1 FL=1|uniref:mannitol dehydrogenase family protein n=1 Tax=Amaricoccus sp. TaxID=1872485 RepID=UPI002C40AC56|nr:mannitol dehydrogenase family protein [Amaricoccus sp.]HMQ94142.1 mannitol dehydrogenase family protein [Amaricoccus sp.]HMR52077.1 mannitol dehydrogenase family protein [Amaricoccus sp.]HMR60728.1 mannitol dehydrogenase family protein [Amaricoccus sp.]HMT98879.1 mannitol dehydrogenase family protein [Amaricoccus sp.]